MTSIPLEPEYQEQLLAVVPKFSAALGLPSCILLMAEVFLAHGLHNPALSKGGNPILRSLAFVAFFQALDALGWFLSTWAVPAGDFAYSTGNIQTCDFQGFLLQVVIGAPLFSCAMAWYFWLIVARGKTSQELLVYERWISPIIVLYAFGSSFFLLGKKMYNHIGAVCWIQGSPPGCGNSSYRGGGEPCERGDWAWLYGMVMFYIPLWICILLIVIFNISNYVKLRRDGDSGEARWFAAQSGLYALAFVVTWAPSTTWSGLHWKVDGGSFIVDILAAWFEPLGGFWNLLIFLRNRPASRRRVMRLVCCECCEPNDEDHDAIDADGPPPKEVPPPLPKHFRRKPGSSAGGGASAQNRSVDGFEDEQEEEQRHTSARRNRQRRPSDTHDESASMLEQSPDA
ncbi:expressed unknown protein [Seminavis robusta]|uniref:G-protein coupled receptors family 2 profile 2 domain-containing protein n=1 Tax=Seminavis robusta TaxID=568900 RepID=A0A9N8H5B3_9STRA|nr:expressed unknown protein [Seminavis robusta]|eukprot:Sro138_g064840.1 n/a (399) ;mRNA; f:84781-85977